MRAGAPACFHVLRKLLTCCMQAMKARGEPLLTGFECTPAGMAAAFQPKGWELTELLGPKCAPPQKTAESTVCISYITSAV